MWQTLLQPVTSILDKLIPDPVARDKAKLQLLQLEKEGELDYIKSQMNVILAEANGESWLQRNWRPITMLTFVALIVAKWLGYTAPGISEEIEKELMNLVQIGLGGYVVGRSAEKVMHAYKK